MAQTIEPVRLSQVPRARVRASVQKYRVNFVCILQGGHGHDNKWMERLIIIHLLVTNLCVVFKLVVVIMRENLWQRLASDMIFCRLKIN